MYRVVRVVLLTSNGKLHYSAKAQQKLVHNQTEHLVAENATIIQSIQRFLQKFITGITSDKIRVGREILHSS